MWELNYKESWTPKNWCFWTVVLEKTLESPVDCKETQPVHSRGNQSRIFIGRTDAEPEAPILWPPDVKNWLIGKDCDAGKDWRQEEKGMTEDEMVGWHQPPRVGDGQGSLACCSPWGHKELDMTERLKSKNNEIFQLIVCTQVSWCRGRSGSRDHPRQAKGKFVLSPPGSVTWLNCLWESFKKILGGSNLGKYGPLLLLSFSL